MSRGPVQIQRGTQRFCPQKDEGMGLTSEEKLGVLLLLKMWLYLKKDNKYPYYFGQLSYKILLLASITIILINCDF